MERMALQGPRVVLLPRGYKFDNIAITDYITKILEQFGIQDSYGILAAVQNSAGEINPTVIFGLPGLKLVESDLPQPPSNLRLLVQNDCMLLVAGHETRWAMGPVRNLQKLDLQPCSVGLDG